MQVCNQNYGIYDTVDTNCFLLSQQLKIKNTMKELGSISLQTILSTGLSQIDLPFWRVFFCLYLSG